MNITVFGSSSTQLDEKYYKECELFADLLAKNNNLVYGAGNMGIMKIFGDAFKRHNRVITGVITKKLHLLEAGDKDICTEYLQTDTLPERKDILVDSGDIMLVCPGGIGTIDEMMHVVAQNQLGHMSKDVLLLNSEGFFDYFLEFISKLKEEKFIYDDQKYFYNITSIEKLEEYLATKSK